MSDGVACLAPVRARSEDGAFTLRGGVRLSDDIAGTRADLLAGFEPSAAFRAAAAHRDLTGGLDKAPVARAARGRLADLRWAAQPGAAAPAVDPCARLRQPEQSSPLAPPSAPVALAPAPPRVAAAPVAPETPPEPVPEPAPAVLEPEIPPLAPPPPAALAGEPPPELPLEY